MDKIEFVSKPKDGFPWDVVIVGSGPSGLTSAIYTTRGAASTLIIGGDKWGGQLMLTSSVDNFPGFPEGIQGPDLMLAMRNQAERFGALFLEKNATSVDFTKKPYEIMVGNDKYLANSVIIATGAQTKWLDVPGSQKLVGRGISSCAPCDAPFFKNKNVIVVGGGDSAMEEALVLTKYAAKVYIVHRREEFRASQAMQKKVLDNKSIEVVWNTEIVEVKGESKVESVVLLNNKTNQKTEMNIDGIFVAIGHKPDSDIFKGLVDMDEKGYLLATDTTKTKVSGVFIAGDVYDTKYKQAITAAGLGCMAGMDALSYLEGNR